MVDKIVKVEKMSYQRTFCEVYNQKDSEGFIALFGLPIKVKAMLDQSKKNK